MRTFAAVALLCLVGGSRALCPTTTARGALRSASARARCPALRANEFDVWWEERRRRGRTVGLQNRAAQQANEPDYNPMSSADRARRRKERAAAAVAADAAAPSR